MIPAGITSTGWPAVAARCAEFGDSFDAWQDGLGRVILGRRADGLYAATVGGVTLSIPRQVAKTFLTGRIVFGLCTLYPRTRVLWTAHRTRTATNTFRGLAGYAQRPAVAAHVAAVRSANGEQEITFTNGSQLLFGAREQGFGRGFDEVDIEVFDEAQILTLKALEDMVAATNQARHPHGALILYMGTPPRPVDPGQVFADRRADALALKGTGPDFGAPVQAGDEVYVECSADPLVGRPGGPSLDDEAQWRIANPSYPERTPRVSMLRLRKQLKSDEAWRREGLGVWDPGAGAQATIPAGIWSGLFTDRPPTRGVVAVGVKFSVDGAWVSAAAARRGETGTHVEALGVWPAVDGAAVLTRLLAGMWRKVAVITIDGKSGAGGLRQALLDAGVPGSRITVPQVADVQTAHSMFLTAVHDATVSHSNQPGLTAAVAAAVQRPIGKAGGWGWAAIGEGDVTPLDAATFAMWGAVTTKRRPGRAVRGRVL